MIELRVVSPKRPSDTGFSELTPSLCVTKLVTGKGGFAPCPFFRDREFVRQDELLFDFATLFLLLPDFFENHQRISSLRIY